VNSTEVNLIKQEPALVKAENLLIKKESNEQETIMAVHSSPASRPSSTHTSFTVDQSDKLYASTTNDIIDSAVKQLEICDRILSIAQSHQISCSYTKLKREQLFENTLKCKKQLQLSVSLPSNSSTNPNLIDDMQKLEMWRCLCALIGPDIMRIVEFAKRIPGFNIS
jgi:hypothetical protein